jgi:hypothetical protein
MLSGMNRRSLLALLAGSGFAATALSSFAAAIETEAAPGAAPAGAPGSAAAALAAVGVSTRTDVDKLPSVPELPDPFTFADGTKVTSPADWPRRRAELVQLAQTYEYGHMPPTPPAGQVRVAEDPAYKFPPPAGSNAATKPAKGATEASTTKPAVPAEPDYPAGTTVTKYLLTVGPDGDTGKPAADKSKQVSFHLVLTVPPGKGPFPVVVRGDLCWGRVKPPIAAEVARRGYILADFDRTEIVPDKKGERNVGAYLVYPDGDFSATAAWAWGYHRVIDHLLTRPDVARDQIAVTGHSRGGKTTLLAGLTDERIALTVPNNSGCGGAGCYRYQPADSEDIGRITKNFPYWFQAKFPEFIGKVDRLPIDQHSVKAAFAPRALLTCEATGDRWANPEGAQITYAAAKSVYDWLGAGDKIAIHYRPGKHEQNYDDWQTLLDFADKLFAGKPGKTEFNKLEYPDVPKPWSWSAPK